MKKQGNALQDELARKTELLATELVMFFRLKNIPLDIAYYRSLWRLRVLEDIPYSELFFVLMRQNGIHIWDGFPCYMTSAYTDEDLTHLITTFKDCINVLISNGILKSKGNSASGNDRKKTLTKELNKPPLPGAKLGFDKTGKPAWFIKDVKNENEFVQVDI